MMRCRSSRGHRNSAGSHLGEKSILNLLWQLNRDGHRRASTFIVPALILRFIPIPVHALVAPAVRPERSRLCEAHRVAAWPLQRGGTNRLDVGKRVFRATNGSVPKANSLLPCQTASRGRSRRGNTLLVSHRHRMPCRARPPEIRAYPHRTPGTLLITTDSAREDLPEQIARSAKRMLAL
jgi:hypothetical protein